MIPSLFLFMILWNSNAAWHDNSTQTTLYPNQHLGDTQFTGEGTATITKDGRVVLEGDAPRYRILEPLIENVSITMDARRVSEDEDLAYQGFVIGARSQHYDDSECGANTYYASVTYDDGLARFEKELYHGTGTNAFYPDFDSDELVQVFDDDNGVPKNVWIKLNFTVTTTEDNNARLELSVNGKQVLEYVDNGNWPVDPENDVECEGFYPENKIIQSPGFVFIRNDGLGRAEYRNLEIRELK
jgi:hypothetical protein